MKGLLKDWRFCAQLASLGVMIYFSLSQNEHRYFAMLLTILVSWSLCKTIDRHLGRSEPTNRLF